MDDDLTIQARGALAAEEEASNAANELVKKWIKEHPFCFGVYASDDDPHSSVDILSLHIAEKEASKAIPSSDGPGGWYKTTYSVRRVETTNVPAKVVRELIKSRVCLQK